MTTTAAVPAGALAEAVRVKVAVPPAVTAEGLKEAVTPAGRPEALKVTVCALPAVTAVVTRTVPAPPAARLAVVGLATMLKSSVGAELDTETLTAAVCQPLAAWPLKDTVKVPWGAPAVVNVATVLLPEVTEGGLNATVIPLGIPWALNVMV